jgi:hypothetical protein
MGNVTAQRPKPIPEYSLLEPEQLYGMYSRGKPMSLTRGGGLRSLVKVYETMDRQDLYRPYRVEIYKSPNQVVIASKDYTLTEPLTFRFRKYFVGDNNNDAGSNYAPKGVYPGNSLLFETGPGKYLFVMDTIFEFETVDQEPILLLSSPVDAKKGNGPYPYAIGKNYTYVLRQNDAGKRGMEIVPNQQLNLRKEIRPRGVYTQLHYDLPSKRQLKSLQKRFYT